MRRLFRYATVIALFACSVLAQSSARETVEAVLDNWNGRENARLSISKITKDPVSVLSVIASSSTEPSMRRLHAIGLLGVFPDSRTDRVLQKIGSDKLAALRCPALESLVEENAAFATRILVEKLTDSMICGTEVSTDSGTSHPVRVSEDAARLLTLINGKPCESADHNEETSEIACWREWLTERQKGKKP